MAFISAMGLCARRGTIAVMVLVLFLTYGSAFLLALLVIVYLPIRDGIGFMD